MTLSYSSFHGRPRKFADGFVGVNKRIYITDETFSRWRSLRADLNLSTHDLLAHCLLDHFSLCIEEQSQVCFVHKHTVIMNTSFACFFMVKRSPVTIQAVE